MSKKIIAVVGATGSQGGGLVRAICEDAGGGFAARAITRSTDSDKARALAAMGAEVVAANVDDEASLRRAFEGAHGVYGVTFFWDHFSPEREKAQASAIAAASRAVGARHVIWSTLDDSRQYIPLDDTRMPTLMGRYKVPHFDAKAEADAYFAGLPVTYLLTSFYWDNLIHFGMAPRRGEDGRLTFTLPMGDRKLPQIAAADIGRCAYGIFQRGEEFTGKRVGIAGEHLTGAEMCARLGRALGETVTHVSPPFDVYRGLGFPGADDLGNMFQFNHDCADAFCAARSVEFSRTVNPRLQTFEQWLRTNASRMATG
ncbi:MAG: NmrA/HSCARG family protein [Bryobacterales bacterium]|nr:NmrA/HSCARG family protein [Bryobacterales bacterium]